MKKKYKIILLTISLIFSALLLMLKPTRVKASTDYTYTFDDNSLYDSSSIVYNFTQNLYNTTTTYGGVYDASFTFTGQANGSNPIGWTATEGNGFIDIVDEADDHDNIIMFYDSGGASNILEGDWTEQESGTVEYWFYSTDTAKQFYVSLKGNGGTQYICQLYTSGNLWYYNDGTGKSTGITAQENTWTHIRIDWEAGGGGYMGLGTDDYYYYINGIRGWSDFHTATTGCDVISMATGSTPSGWINYIDAIGSSQLWSNYTIGNNYVPNYTISEAPEKVNRYEFAYEGIGDINDAGEDNANGWTDYETPSGDMANIDTMVGYPVIDYPDRRYNIESTGVGHIHGIRKEDFSFHATQINLTLGFYLKELATDGLYFTMTSYDGTDVFKVAWQDTGVFAFYDGSSYHTIESDIVASVLYDYNFFIDYDSGSCVATYWADGIYNGTSMLSLYDFSGKEGVEGLYFNAHSDDASKTECDLDYIGIYANGTSIVEDSYALKTIDFGLPGDTWDFQQEYLLFVNGSGNFSIGVSSNWYYPGGTYYNDIVSEYEYSSNETRFINVYDGDSTDITNPFLVIWLEDDANNISVNSISVEGVNIVYGANEYPLIFEHSGIETNSSYFYVDSDDYLRYSITFDDNNTEYIQAYFDIPDLNDDNYSFGFLGSETGAGYGYTGLEYTDTSNLLFNILSTPLGQSFYLDDGKTIDRITILLTDNDNFDSGSSSGFFTYFTLTYIANMDLTLGTLDFIDGVLILVVLLVPTLLVFEATKRKAVIVPMLLAMTLIAFATTLIPAWLFLILVFSFGGFFFLKYKRGDFSS